MGRGLWLHFGVLQRAADPDSAVASLKISLIYAYRISDAVSGDPLLQSVYWRRYLVMAGRASRRHSGDGGDGRFSPRLPMNVCMVILRNPHLNEALAYLPLTFAYPYGGIVRCI